MLPFLIICLWVKHDTFFKGLIFPSLTLLPCLLPLLEASSLPSGQNLFFLLFLLGLLLKKNHHSVCPPSSLPTTLLLPDFEPKGEDTDVNVTTSCVWGKGTDYRGTMNVTPEGVICQRWDSQFPHNHSFLPHNFKCK